MIDDTTASTDAQPQMYLIPPAASRLDRTPRTPVEPRHRHLAGRIKRFAVAQGIVVSIQRAKWADSVALLCKTVDFDQVERVWAWYEQNYRPGGPLPRLRSAAHFRSCWQWVVDRMEYSEQRRPLAPEELSPDAFAALEQMADLTWRTDVTPLVPTVVQRSCVAVRAFMDRLATVPEHSPFAGVASCAALALGSVPVAVARYLRRINQDKDRKWAQWSGDLVRWTWDPTRPDCVADARRAVRTYTGQDESWDRLMQEMDL